jgi:hypothetical protein
MRRIVAFVTILLPVALLAAQAGNNPLFSTNPHSKINLALTRLAHHPHAQHVVHVGHTKTLAEQRTTAFSHTAKGGLVPVNTAHMPGLSPLSQGDMMQTFRQQSRANGVTQLAQEEEEEEDDGDDEGDDGEEEEGEGEEEEGEGGWDRTWDAPKLG